MQSEYNVLYENWVRVRKMDGTTAEVSAMDALTLSHEYVALAGETPTQDVSMLRFLETILFTVFSRVTEEGEVFELLDAEDAEEEALVRWKAIWDMKHFPQAPIENYLKQWEDRFWLFDDRYPFWQIPRSQKATEFSAAKLNGEVLESNNKVRLFSCRSGDAKAKLSFAEAARWLLSVNNWDDSASTKSNVGNAPGCGWLGKCGTIYAVGSNLFETLMLNLTLLKDGREAWGYANPYWERDVELFSDSYSLAMPDNPAELYSMRSRYMTLKREPNQSYVVGVFSTKKENFSTVNAFAEQMTMWSCQNKRGDFEPKKHAAERQMWRDFGAVFDVNAVQKEKRRKPGIVSWAGTLTTSGCVPMEKPIRFSIVDVVYDSSMGSIQDCFGDAVSFHAGLLSEKWDTWGSMIAKEITQCETAASYVGKFASDIVRASGISDEAKHKKIKMYEYRGNLAKEMFYSEIDVPFREWLYRLIPDDIEHCEEYRMEWRRTARKIALSVGRDLAKKAGTPAFVGRKREKSPGEERRYSTPQAYNIFKANINKLYREV